MAQSWLPDDAWWNVTAPLTGGTTNRSASLLNRIVDQFDVEHTLRYVPRGGTTFCNVFLNDVTRALACEINHLEIGAGGPKELDANKMIEWVTGPTGRRHGWTECRDAAAARSAADRGFPTVVTWYNPKGIGHVAMAVPAPLDAPSDGRVYIAQAGASNFRCGLVSRGFGSLPVRYFTHA